MTSPRFILSRDVVLSDIGKRPFGGAQTGAPATRTLRGGVETGVETLPARLALRVVMRAVAVPVHRAIRMDRSAHVGGFVTNPPAAQPDGGGNRAGHTDRQHDAGGGLCRVSQGLRRGAWQTDRRVAGAYPDSASSPADEMRVGGRMFFGQSWICSYWFCPPTQINYDLHLTSAQIFAERLQITSRDDILRAVGRGIGNTAAHEFGHRRNFVGMDRRGRPMVHRWRRR